MVSHLVLRAHFYALLTFSGHWSKSRCLCDTTAKKTSIASYRCATLNKNHLMKQPWPSLGNLRWRVMRQNYSSVIFLTIWKKCELLKTPSSPKRIATDWPNMLCSIMTHISYIKSMFYFQCLRPLNDKQHFAYLQNVYLHHRLIYYFHVGKPYLSIRASGPTVHSIALMLIQLYFGLYYIYEPYPPDFFSSLSCSLHS